uniref:Chemerin chemokine-like receptor 2 n=1 Tax=Eptatretus burgeri TaxID=7764 RepID=A0A8C4R3X3_EPTBU
MMEGISTEFPTFTPLFIGNAVVIWIIGFKMKKTMATVLFLNLSIADFLFILFLPFSITQAIMEYHWIFGWFFCKLNSYIMFVNMYSSILFLTVISMERYIAVVHPVQGMKIRTLHSETMTARISEINICRAIFGFIIPFTVIFFCYCRVVCKMQHIRFAKKRKSFRLIVLVVLAFFICWAPYHVLNYELFVLANNVFPVVISIAYINSCINPILYVFSGQKFQEKIRRSFSKAIENKAKPFN